jgi:VRR-NUC domain
VARLRLQCRPGVEFWHTPNGAHLRTGDEDDVSRTDARQGAKLKAMGLRPGVSDLLFAWDDNGRLRMLLLELKARGRDLSPAQRTFKASMKAIGAYFEMADTVDEAVRVLKQYRILPR